MSTRRTGGFPGSDYLQRVGEAWLTAVGNHTSAINRMWDDARAGNFDHARAFKTWVEMADGYFDAAVEASRGPGFVLQPTWAYLDFTPADPDDDETHDEPESLEAPVKLSRTEGQSVKVAPTVFAQMEGGPSLPTDAYVFCDWVDGSRSRIFIKLNKEVIRNAPSGQYISFLLAEGRTGEPPLAIVMLRLNRP
jgi:hypothetical protein